MTPDRLKVCKLKINGSTAVYAAPKDHDLDDLRHSGMFEELSMFIAEAAPGESLEIEVAEMTQEAYDTLPEFEGW